MKLIKLDPDIFYEEGTVGIYKGSVIMLKSTPESVDEACKKCFFSNGGGIEGCSAYLSGGYKPLRCVEDFEVENHYWAKPEMYMPLVKYPLDSVVCIEDKFYKIIQRDEVEDDGCGGCSKPCDVYSFLCTLADSQIFEELEIEPDICKVVDLMKRELVVKKIKGVE